MLKTFLVCTVGIPSLVPVRYFPVTIALLQLTTHTYETAVNIFPTFLSLLFSLYDAAVLCAVALLFFLDVQFLICAVLSHSNKKISFIMGRWEYDY